MERKILAASMAVVLVVAFVVPTMLDSAQARHTARPAGTNVLGDILNNLREAEETTWHVKATAHDIREDLKVKKKFYTITETDEVTANQAFDPWLITLEAICLLPEELDGTDPCAFNLESLLVTVALPNDSLPETSLDFCNVGAHPNLGLLIDGVTSEIDVVTIGPAEINGDTFPLSTNVLAENSLPLIGASHEIGIFIDCQNSMIVTVEFNGERPQAMDFIVTFEEAEVSENGV